MTEFLVYGIKATRNAHFIAGPIEFKEATKIATVLGESTKKIEPFVVSGVSYVVISSGDKEQFVKDKYSWPRLIKFQFGSW